MVAVNLSSVMLGLLNSRPLRGWASLAPRPPEIYWLMLLTRCMPISPSSGGSQPMSGTYSAPMPGTILDVKVTAGQAVKSGDVLMVLEAMKMENEIMAPCDGTIKQVVTAKGASVNSGDPLIVIG